MTVLYLQHVYTSISVSETGHNHTRSEPDDGDTPMAIDCDACAPFLVRDFAAVHDPDQVPLTDRQIAAREKAEREGNVAVRQAAEALANAAANAANQPAATKRATRQKSTAAVAADDDDD